MQPEKAWDSLSAYLDDELPAAERAALEALLKTDAGLRARLERLRDASAFFRAHGGAELPAGLKARVLDRLDASRPFWERPWFGPSASFAFAAAALVLVFRAGGLRSFEEATVSAERPTLERRAEAPGSPAEPAAAPEPVGSSVADEVGAAAKKPAAEPLRTVEEAFEAKGAENEAGSESLTAIRKDSRFSDVQERQKSLTEILYEKEMEREQRPVALDDGDLKRGFGGQIDAPAATSPDARMFEVPELAGRSRVVGAQASLAGFNPGGGAATMAALSAPAPAMERRILARVEANAQVFRSSEPWNRFWTARRIVPPEVDFSQQMIAVLIPVERVDPRLLEVLEPRLEKDHILLPYRFTPATAANLAELSARPPLPVKSLERSDLPIRTLQVP